MQSYYIHWHCKVQITVTVHISCYAFMKLSHTNICHMHLLSAKKKAKKKSKRPTLVLNPIPLVAVPPYIATFEFLQWVQYLAYL